MAKLKEIRKTMKDSVVEAIAPGRTEIHMFKIKAAGFIVEVLSYEGFQSTAQNTQGVVSSPPLAGLDQGPVT